MLYSWVNMGVNIKDVEDFLCFLEVYYYLGGLIKGKKLSLWLGNFYFYG